MSRIGFPRHHFPSVESTMDIIFALAGEGAPHGTIVVADEQTAGRGRAGRRWNAPAGSSLLMSVLLRPTVSFDKLPTLPLIVGVAVAEAIESIADFSEPIALKWPNDIFIHSKKLAGVLMHSRGGGDVAPIVNIGIGINISSTRNELPESGTSVWLESNARATSTDIELAVLERLEERYEEWIESGPNSGLTAWRSRAMYIGALVTVVQDSRELTGVFRDITDSGALLIESASGVHEVVAGDLVRGPRPTD